MIKAELVPWSSVVGGGILIKDETGKVIVQLAMLGSTKLDEKESLKEASERIGNLIVNAINNQNGGK